MRRQMVVASLAVTLLLALAVPASASSPVSVASGKSTVMLVPGSGCPSGPWDFHAQAKIKPNGAMTASFWWTEDSQEYSFDLIENPPYPFETVQFFPAGDGLDHSQAYFFVEFEELAGTTLDDFILCLVAMNPFGEFPDGITEGHPLIVAVNDYGPGIQGQDEIVLSVVVPGDFGSAVGYATNQVGNVTVKAAS